jgi:hypothetical protein
MAREQGMSQPTVSDGQLVMLRTRSHRARERLDRAIGRHPDYYWTWEDGGCFAEVTAEEYEKVKSIKGITRAKVPRENLRRCWNWSV